ncbi:MAG: indole-3-glycerol-phosphate synthase [Methanolinea sp.]|nr:indole-3-glycerol-phosphate synthase [Methanolinea sp.]
MILDRIVEATQSRIAALPAVPDQPHPRPGNPRRLSSALGVSHDRNAIIAEIKFASPSRGTIRAGSDPQELARMFVSSGCAALSVLTEPAFFHGRPEFITAIREQVEVPILRKDFIIDERQLVESRMLGADAVLLIAALLRDRLPEFVDLALRLGLEPLVEVHSGEEMMQALDTGTRIVGINNRNLATLTIDLSTTLRLAPMARKAGRIVVSESGILWPADIRTLRPYADAFLIGSSIMSSSDPEKTLEGFLFA